MEYYNDIEKRVSDYGQEIIESGEGTLTVVSRIRSGYEIIRMLLDANATASEHPEHTNEQIRCAKVEYGTIATPWTPAPEDIVVKSELEALAKRVEALEGK